MSISVKVVNADALQYETDVLALKHAQGLYGVDLVVFRLLAEAGIDLRDQLPKIDGWLLVRSAQVVSAREILFLGVPPLGIFDYQTIRKFSRAALATLKGQRPAVKHLAMTLHGRGFGLDEAEAFRAEIAGLLDAVAAREAPPGLISVSILERDKNAAGRMTDLLRDILPAGVIEALPKVSGGPSASLDDARTNLGAVGHDSRKKPHIFVAMPFADQYADRFHYGISGAVKTAGYLCERADFASFTGDIIAWVKDRIGSATLVVADLTSANANVYLEVGYAWGRGVDTILLIEEGHELKFDVHGQRCLRFRSIQDLEKRLTAELSLLRDYATKSDEDDR